MVRTHLHLVKLMVGASQYLMEMIVLLAILQVIKDMEEVSLIRLAKMKMRKDQ